MSFIPKPHEIYKHFKGNLYQITAVAEHTETGETLVVYQAMYGDFKTYAQPLAMFISPVDREQYPDAAQEFCFELQGPDAARQRAEMGMCSRAEGMRSDVGATGKAVVRETERQPKQASAASETSQGQLPPETDEESEEFHIDPMVLEFLDADSYEQRLNILTGLHHRITDDMITTMAIACDVEVPDGDIEERYESLKTCLLTMERYECNRLR
ncbi:MAG: DUF1653 domain-containing protein [Lachnospiraceae bacterium]|nr:DUF1653 domain-containing protein [Butyrivibrio sp.]MCM1342558.1 DUF1653 domain-containing protein [Muribaculaceae bacterium]MCM1412223.1 DUF1653 domain-containing protein [Lachnospiraceae bacterium]